MSLGFIGLPELDKIIILNCELKDVVHISLINGYLKNLVIQLLPEIIHNNYSLDNFVLYLFEKRVLDVLTELLTIYDNIKNKHHKLYNKLTSSIIGYFMNIMDETDITDYFSIAPDDYDWDTFANVYYEYCDMSYENGNYDNMIIVFNEILLFVKSATLLNNNKLLTILNEIWLSYLNAFNLLNEYDEIDVMNNFCVGTKYYIGPFNNDNHKLITNKVYEINDLLKSIKTI